MNLKYFNFLLENMNWFVYGFNDKGLINGSVGNCE